jgi:hypothetical protein
MGRIGTAIERRSAAGSAGGGRGPVAERLLAAVEHGLTRAIERRVGGSAGERRPGRLEQRLVAVLERRLAARSPKRLETRAWARVGQTLTRRAPSGKLARGPQKTLRALVVSIVARAMVKTLVRLLRLLSRGLISRPMRRLLGLLARRAFRAGPANQVGFLGFLGAAILLVYRVLARRLAGMPALQQTAVKLGIRGLRRVLSFLLGLFGKLLGTLWTLLRRELRRGLRAYSER